jgi:DNA-binding transcriptional ArsR family regulator
MEEQNNFIAISSLLGEPARAKMLWSLLDGRAYTATELAHEADISPTSASNHLSKLLEADLVKVEVQGKHRYYSFFKPEVAYVVESMASLATPDGKKISESKKEVSGIKFCRTCYDHLAGYIGVQIAEAMELKSLIKKSGNQYTVTDKGWKWINSFGITKEEVLIKRRPLARQCLDWSERRPHLAGQLGAILLSKMLEKKWFRSIQFSRELIITAKGRKEMNDLLGMGI